jgi:hypothetical protein
MQAMYVYCRIITVLCNYYSSDHCMRPSYGTVDEMAIALYGTCSAVLLSEYVFTIGLGVEPNPQ